MYISRFSHAGHIFHLFKADVNPTFANFITFLNKVTDEADKLL